MPQSSASKSSSRKCNSLKLRSQKYSICWREANAHFQREFLLAVMTKYKGNRTVAANELGISRRTLQLQLKTLLPELYEQKHKNIGTTNNDAADAKPIKRNAVRPPSPRLKSQPRLHAESALSRDL